MNLILASTSRYRAGLLEKLRLPFVQIDPDFIEDEIEGENPETRCCRLAAAKAAALAGQLNDSAYLILASDQVASLRGEVLHKPGDFDTALGQLSACSGQWVSFDTAISLLASDGTRLTRSERFEVRFRSLTEAQVIRYLNLDEPYDCAGSIKAESLGIALIEDTRGRDVNTLLGLPLMLLTEMLSSLGIEPLNEIR